MQENHEMTDAELLRQYQLDKNPSSLNILFSRYLDVGFRTAMRYMRNSSDAEDVLQTAFIQFLNNLHLFHEDASSIKPWLMKMIVNASLKKIREEKNRSNRQQSVASQKFSKYSAQENSVEKANDTEALKSKIKTMMDTLPEKYRSPIWLVLYEGFSYPEVATVLSLPEKTVRTQVSRGLERLKEILGSFGSVLSVDVIATLMTQSAKEMAPVTAKQIIESQSLYQAIGTKPLKAASHSSRMLAVKPTFFTFKFIASILSVLTLSFGAIFIYNNHHSKQTIAVVEQNEIYKTWDLKNKEDRNLKLSMGSWEWSETLKSMATPMDQGVIVELPPITNDRLFMIECVILPNQPEKPIGPVDLFASACWLKGDVLISHEEHIAPTFYTLKLNKTVKQVIYCYKNYICAFTNGVMVRCDKYPDHLTNAKFGLFTINFAYQIITCQTIKTPPKELLEAIETFQKNPRRTQLDWNINTSAIVLTK